MPGKRTWTKDQEHAIEARGGTLIVSAAAGSGKTAVLVERCIQRLTDTDHPCSADKLLIVTFTRAATAEMRSRLAEAIAKKLAEDPENKHLQTQQMLLPSADICTIDAFCGNLVRENFERVQINTEEGGLSPDFRLLDESEVQVLQQSALEQVLEELYQESAPAFHQLVELLATGRDDTGIEDTILRLYTFSRAYPSPRTWLQNALRLYEDNSPAVALLQEALEEFLVGWQSRWEYAEKLLRKEQKQSDLNYTGTLQSVEEYLALLEEWKELVSKQQFDALLQKVTEGPIPGLKKPTLKDKKTTPLLDLLREYKANFTPAKLKAALFPLLPGSAEDRALDNEALYPVAACLVDAVQRFDSVYRELKYQENALDFADMELLALSLLVEDPSEEPFRRTELAETLRERYEEVLIDEYQDTNKLQDTIFAALSRDNLFMVGDVKQSIYRFRQAMPELFLAKKEAYPLYDREQDRYPATVILGKNFRSRKGVLAGVNHTFTRLMSPAVGDISYDNSEQLYFGADFKYQDRETPDVEFHVVVPEEGIVKQEAEAAHIAAFIAKEISDSKKTDTPLTYRDFAILMRSPGKIAPIYRKVLTEAGIPVYAESGSGFLDTAEIMTILSFLRVIDNPMQDVPLLSVLLSPLFGFSEDDVAALRIKTPKGNLYKALLSAEEENPACHEFLKDLRHFRTLSVSMGAGELLRRIYDETSYDAIVEAMNLGEQRIANLQMLLQLADNYDANSSYGVAGFLRHLDKLSRQKSPISTAATLSPNANVVQIMSIHKSKGLEFKVCIVADLNHRFNDGFLTESLILHPELGLGLKGRQPGTGFTYPTLVHSAIKQASLRSERSEALRVLYVAMTRAEEKLVLTACDAPRKGGKTDPLASSVLKAAQKLYGDGVVPPGEVLSSKTFYEWCLMAFLQHPDAGLLRAQAAGTALSMLPTEAPETPYSLKVVLDRKEYKNTLFGIPPEVEQLVEADPQMKARIAKRAEYRYPYQNLSTALSKRSASHLRDKPFSTEYFAETRPESLSRDGMTPAERGTCLHKFMQYADFTRAATAPEEELRRLVEEGFLLQAEADVVDTGRVKAFFASNIAERMQKSPRVLREHKFAILLPAGQFEEHLTSAEAEETVFIQGIIDCAFEENDTLVLLDYKTDRVKDAKDLRLRYEDQLSLYKLALEETLGLPVSTVLLYSFHLGEEVPVF